LCHCTCSVRKEERDLFTTHLHPSVLVVVGYIVDVGLVLVMAELVEGEGGGRM